MEANTNEIVIKPQDRPCAYPNVWRRERQKHNETLLMKGEGGAGEMRGRGLNLTGKLIWSLCDGVHSFQDILQVLQEHFDDIEEQILNRDLKEFISELVAQRFLWLCSDSSSMAADLSSGSEPVHPLFIMGNKRSGTTLLVTLLNLHPNIFLTDESDIIWILYQAIQGEPYPYPYTCYPWDDPEGMHTTLHTCHHILHACLSEDSEEGDAIATTFFRVQKHLMNTGLRHQPPYRKKALAWIGDKKPVQHSDPELRAFLGTHFPEARYIHIVRDPRAVVMSMIKAAKDWGGIGPKYWNAPPQTLLERWTIHEEWILHAKSSEKSPIYTIRFEDLCQTPFQKVTDIFDFLDIEIPVGIAAPICNLVHPYPNQKFASFPFPISPHTARIMQIYNYL